MGTDTPDGKPPKHNNPTFGEAESKYLSDLFRQNAVARKELQPPGKAAKPRKQPPRKKPANTPAEPTGTAPVLSESQRLHLSELVAVMPPPTVEKRRPMKRPWEKVERYASKELNGRLVFPPDFKAFIDVYGNGRIDDFLSLAWSSEDLDEVRERREWNPAIPELHPDVPFPVFPEPGGLLTCGMTDNGDRLYWLTRGRPDEWTTAVVNWRDDDFHLYDMPIVRLLTKLLSRELRCPVLTEDFPSDKPLFKPG